MSPLEKIANGSVWFAVGALVAALLFRAVNTSSADCDRPMPKASVKKVMT